MSINCIRNTKEQEKTPYLDALKKYVSEDVCPFDVPGHHMGNVQNDFKDFTEYNKPNNQNNTSFEDKNK